MSMILDFPALWVYLFSFLPAPVANMVRGVIVICTILLVMQFITKVKNLIPFF